MENARLVLCPVDPGWVPGNSHDLQQLLQSIQLIGEPFNGEMHFLAGNSFLDLIAFMGCAPDIELEPGDDGRAFCHVHLVVATAGIEFHGGEHSHAPRCPRCRSAVNDWRNRVSDWRGEAADTCWSCRRCGHRAEPWEFNWRKSAGFGSCFIEISNIYPREAIPQQQLLDTLNSRYGTDWQYFYQY